MIKTKWLYSELPIKLESVASELLKEQYYDEKWKGFVLSKSSPNKLTGKYVEKIKGEVITTDPFGNEITQSMISIMYANSNGLRTQIYYVSLIRQEALESLSV